MKSRTSGECRLSSKPSEIADWLEAAGACEARGDRAKAQNHYLRVLGRDPANVPARFGFARQLLARGMVAEGVAQLRRVLRAAPSHVAAQHMLGSVLHRKGDLSNAAAAFAEVIRLQPEHLPTYLELAACERALGQTDGAEATLRRALAQVGEHPVALAHLAILLAAMGRAVEAIDAFKRALVIVGDDAGGDVHFLHAGLAAAYIAEKSFAEAEVHYRRALALNPTRVEGHYNLGILLRRLGRPRDAKVCFDAATNLKRNSPWRDPAAPAEHDGSSTFTMTSKTKLTHDIEQLRYLRLQGALPAGIDPIIAEYELALAEIKGQAETQDIVPLPPARQLALKGVYNRLLHVPPSPALALSPVSPALDAAKIEADYRANHPGIIWFDGFLTPEALAALRRYCLETTIWFGLKEGGGYLGAYMEEGFCSDLLLQIAEDLRRRFPGIFGEHPLLQMWAYKYDSQLSGIAMHADFAAVNVNFWITPDEANLDPAGGGLEIYDCEAPAEWDFAEYNGDPARIGEFLDRSQARRVVIPHRQNRVVIFNSNLFHETAAFRFKPGYENRRINITMLFGERQRPF